MIARLLLSLIVLFACQPLAAAQEDRSSGRQGVVVDESGGAIADARLVVRTTQGASLQQAPRPVTARSPSIPCRSARIGSKSRRRTSPFDRCDWTSTPIRAVPVTHTPSYTWEYSPR